MVDPSLSENVKKYLDFLCLELPTRQVGSPGNQAATDFLARKLTGFGFRTECPEFQCIDWVTGGQASPLPKKGLEYSPVHIHWGARRAASW